jgi:alpha-1,2-mannosyltransferase
MRAADLERVPRGWLIAATGLGAVLVVALAYYARWWVPRSNWLFSGHYALGFQDLKTRFRDIHRVARGINPYSKFDHHQYFTYPPGALLLFWPLTWLKLRTATLWWTLLSELALAGAFFVCWRRWRRSDPWLVAAGSLLYAVLAILIFPPLSIHIALGQLGMFIMVALAVDYLVLAGPAKGVLTGVAAAIKIYPIVFIVAWAIRREWRPALTALASGLATCLIALAIWPSLFSAFVHRQLLSGREVGHFLTNAHYLASSSSPFTIFFRWPFHGGTAAHVVGWLATLAAVALLLFAGDRLWRVDRAVGSFVMVMAASVLAGPVTWDHYYTFAPLLIFVALESRDRRAVWVTSLVAMVVYAVPWQISRNDSLTVDSFSLRALQVLVSRNALDVATLALGVAAIYSTRPADTPSASERRDELVAPSP